MGKSFDHWYFDQTVLHPVGLAAIIVLGILMLVLPRKHAIWPMLICACFIASAQRIYILGMNFTLLRVMVLFGWARLLARGECKGLVWQKMDSILVAWTISGTVIYLLQYRSFEAFVLKAGVDYDILGLYFLFRYLIRDWVDLDRMITALAVVAVPVAIAFLFENSTGKNLFSCFGGVPADTIIRDGKLRCQGAFSHSILAGCFFATIVPFFLAQFTRGGINRVLALTGTVCAVTIVILCRSSTPVGALAASIGAMCLYRFRDRMRMIRWGIVFVLLALQCAMQKPVWFLLARIDLVGGSTGYHRYKLIDAAIHHFGEWCLLGTRSTGQWGFFLFDVANQYVLEGVRGGFLTFCLFIAMLVIAFKCVGTVLRMTSKGPRCILTWAIGSALFAHCMSFLAVDYFGQIIMLWYLQLAIIATIMEQYGTAKQVAPARRNARASHAVSRIAPQRVKPIVARQ